MFNIRSWLFTLLHLKIELWLKPLDKNLTAIVINRIDHIKLNAKLIPLVEQLESEDLLESRLSLHVGETLEISNPVESTLPILGLVILMQDHVFVLEKW